MLTVTCVAAARAAAEPAISAAVLSNSAPSRRLRLRMNFIDPPWFCLCRHLSVPAFDSARPKIMLAARLFAAQDSRDSKTDISQLCRPHFACPARGFRPLFTGAHDGQSDEIGLCLSRAVEILRGDGANVIQALVDRRTDALRMLLSTHLKFIIAGGCSCLGTEYTLYTQYVQRHIHQPDRRPPHVSADHGADPRAHRRRGLGGR